MSSTSTSSPHSKKNSPHTNPYPTSMSSTSSSPRHANPAVLHIDQSSIHNTTTNVKQTNISNRPRSMLASKDGKDINECNAPKEKDWCSPRPSKVVSSPSKVVSSPPNTDTPSPNTNTPKSKTNSIMRNRINSNRSPSNSFPPQSSISIPSIPDIPNPFSPMPSSAGQTSVTSSPLRKRSLMKWSSKPVPLLSMENKGNGDSSIDKEVGKGRNRSDKGNSNSPGEKGIMGPSNSSHGTYGGGAGEANEHIKHMEDSAMVEWLINMDNEEDNLRIHESSKEIRGWMEEEELQLESQSYKIFTGSPGGSLNSRGGSLNISREGISKGSPINSLKGSCIIKSYGLGEGSPNKSSVFDARSNKSSVFTAPCASNSNKGSNKSSSFGVEVRSNKGSPNCSNKSSSFGVFSVEDPLWRAMKGGEGDTNKCDERDNPGIPLRRGLSVLTPAGGGGTSSSSARGGGTSSSSGTCSRIESWQLESIRELRAPTIGENRDRLSRILSRAKVAAESNRESGKSHVEKEHTHDNYQEEKEKEHTSSFTGEGCSDKGGFGKGGETELRMGENDDRENDDDERENDGDDGSGTKQTARKTMWEEADEKTVLQEEATSNRIHDNGNRIRNDPVGLGNRNEDKNPNNTDKNNDTDPVETTYRKKNHDPDTQKELEHRATEDTYRCNHPIKARPSKIRAHKSNSTPNDATSEKLQSSEIPVRSDESAIQRIRSERSSADRSSIQALASHSDSAMSGKAILVPQKAAAHGICPCRRDSNCGICNDTIDYSCGPATIDYSRLYYGSPIGGRNFGSYPPPSSEPGATGVPVPKGPFYGMDNGNGNTDNGSNAIGIVPNNAYGLLPDSAPYGLVPDNAYRYGPHSGGAQSYENIWTSANGHYRERAGSLQFSSGPDEVPDFDTIRASERRLRMRRAELRDIMKEEGVDRMSRDKEEEKDFEEKKKLEMILDNLREREEKREKAREERREKRERMEREREKKRGRKGEENNLDRSRDGLDDIIVDRDRGIGKKDVLVDKEIMGEKKAEKMSDILHNNLDDKDREEKEDKAMKRAQGEEKKGKKMITNRRMLDTDDFRF